jgi:hypothetical protein
MRAMPYHASVRTSKSSTVRTGTPVPGAVVSLVVAPPTASTVPSGRPTAEGFQRPSSMEKRVSFSLTFPLPSMRMRVDRGTPASPPGGGPSAPPKVSTVLRS